MDSKVPSSNSHISPIFPYFHKIQMATVLCWPNSVDPLNQVEFPYWVIRSGLCIGHLMGPFFFFLNNNNNNNNKLDRAWVRINPYPKPYGTLPEFPKIWPDILNSWNPNLRHLRHHPPSSVASATALSPSILMWLPREVAAQQAKATHRGHWLSRTQRLVRAAVFVTAL